MNAERVLGAPSAASAGTTAKSNRSLIGRKIGTAVLLDGISEDHRTYLALGGLGFLLGDGALSYGREKIWETYYNVHLWRGVSLGGDVQRVWNPGYNRDRGPASVFSIRMHIEDAANSGNSR